MSIFPSPNPGSGSPPPTSAPPPEGPPTQQYYAPPPPAYYPPPPAPSGSGKIITLFVAVVLLLGATGYLYWQLDGVKKQLVAANDSAQNRLDKLEEAASLTTRSNRKTVEELKDQLDRARRQAAAAAGEAKDAALKKVDETRAALEAAQQRDRQQFTSDISQVRQATDTANTKITQVDTAVTGVKGDVAATKSQLEKTIAELKRATGELDGHSVLIATNDKELKALQALGERNYVQFTIPKEKKAQRVADVSILLKKADPKKNRYTIELTADDKTVEKKDRGVNEPVQFMTSKARQPYELVVNQVKKNEIVGYLSIPKVMNTRN